MTPILYEWLREMFYKDNHPKYRHLFERWCRILLGIKYLDLKTNV